MSFDLSARLSVVSQFENAGLSHPQRLAPRTRHTPENPPQSPFVKGNYALEDTQDLWCARTA